MAFRIRATPFEISHQSGGIANDGPTGFQPGSTNDAVSGVRSTARRVLSRKQRPAGDGTGESALARMGGSATATAMLDTPSMRRKARRSVTSATTAAAGAAH